MAAQLGTGADDKRSRNIDLNIIPFIDLMSCLTAFLLVTAVWISTAQLDTTPRGKIVDGKPVTEPPRPQLSVLIEEDGIWLGLSPGGELQHIQQRGTEQDWAAYQQALAAHKASPTFADRADIEVAADSTPTRVVRYQDLIHAMDLAHAAGFVDVGLADPRSLTTRPRL
jgi:biopolymer transport protein TolR